MKKDKGEVAKILSLSLITKLPSSLLHYCSPFTSPSKNTTLIPRDVVTHIQVFTIRADIAMESSSQRRHRGHQARPGSQNAQGIPSVHAAIQGRNQEMLKAILMQQSDLISTYDEAGRTPLSYAAYKGFEDMVEYLLKEFPKSISERDKDSSHAVHKACLGGHINVLKVFHLYFPKSLLVADRNGRTILHVAAKEHREKLIDVVSYLVRLPEIGKQLLCKSDDEGDTPLALASESNNRQIQKILQQYMA